MNADARRFDADTDDVNDSPLAVAANAQDDQIMRMLRDALSDKRAMLAYQPVFSARERGKIAFFEALIRISDETGRTLPARQFMGVIEDTELGRIVDCLALELGLAQLARNPRLRLSVNMSARSVGYPAWMETLEKGLDGHPEIGNRLILEITEKSAMLIPELVQGFISKLQPHGIAFALDDFGAEFTSFRYLRDFFFDVVKIHGQFIRGIAENPDNQAVTQALISVAHHLDMYAVAGSIESKTDADTLIRLGVDCVQDYHFGAPTLTPPQDIEAGA